MINNRQAGRRRGRGNSGGGGGGGGQRQGNPGRDNGNRIDSRARGNAAQLHEKYKNLARDAQLSGDRVNIEYYLQFADHYFRVLSEQRSRSDEAQPPRRQQQDWFDADNDGDDECGTEGEPIRANDQEMQGGATQRDGNRNEGQRDGGQREQAQRDGGQRDQQRDGNRSDANRNDGGQRGARSWNQDGDRRPQGRDGQDQGERRPRADREPRGEQPRNDQVRNDQPRADQRGEQRQDVVQPTRVDGEPVRADAPIETPLTQDFVVPEAEAPRRRGRLRRDAAAAPTPVAASETHDGGEATFEADRLPPSLGLSAVASNDTDTPKPRRRRTPRVATDEAAAE